MKIFLKKLSNWFEIMSAVEENGKEQLIRAHAILVA